MVRRLTTLFSSATLVILLLVSFLLHWRLATTLESEDEALMRENFAGLRAVWRESVDPLAALDRKIELEAAGVRHEPYYIRYLQGGEVVRESPEMDGLLPAELFSAARPAGESRLQRHRAADGTLYLLLTEWVEEGGDEVFEAGLDVTHDDELLRLYARDLLLMVLLGTALAALAGVVTARRGLRPLARMSESMRHITASRLDRRLGGGRWPRELADLAGVFDGMMERLEDSFTRLSRYSGDLAHEIRTPLTNLRSEAEVALGRARSEAEYRAVVESSLEEYGRLTTLVDRLLLLARADVGATMLEVRPLQAGAEADAVLEFFGAAAEEKGVALVRRGDGAVRADPVLLRRVFVNLVANALEHTPAGGEIRIEVAPLPDGCRIGIVDTGEGIPAEALARVPERFYRAGAERSGGGRAGTGLGLPLVWSIVRLHGGRAAIESEPGRGTTVTLHLPGQE